MFESILLVPMSFWFLAISAYFFCSFPYAILVARIMRLPSPRLEGSQNPGATNMMRIGGKKAAVLTLLLDLGKGALVIIIAKGYGIGTEQLYFFMLLCLLGHVYPIFYGFRGGKGVATFIGCLLVIAWPVGLGMVITWLLIAKVGKVSSLSAILAVMLTPFYAWLFTQPLAWLLLCCALVLLKHRSNMIRLLQGGELPAENSHD